MTKPRVELSELVNRVAYGGERIVLTRHRRAVAALVSADDLARLERAGEHPTDAAGARLTVVESSLAAPAGSESAAAAEHDGGYDLPGR